MRLDGEDRIYDLHGQDFDVQFSSGYYEKIRLEKSGSNILLELRRGSAPSEASVPPEISVPPQVSAPPEASRHRRPANRPHKHLRPHRRQLAHSPRRCRRTAKSVYTVGSLQFGGAPAASLRAARSARHINAAWDIRPSKMAS